MSVFKDDQKVQSPNMFSSNPILRKPFQNDQQSVAILCFWCLIISNLIKADDAATRKKTAPELFMTHLAEVIQPVADPFLPEMENVCFLWLLQKLAAN